MAPRPLSLQNVGLLQLLNFKSGTILKSYFPIYRFANWIDAKI